MKTKAEYDQYPNSLLNRSIREDIDRLTFAAKTVDDLIDYIWNKYGLPKEVTLIILSHIN